MKPVNNISEELESLAPALIPALGIQVYTVPDRYFEEFPYSFYPEMNRNHKPAMMVPEGYFDGFADSVMQKIRSVEASLPAVKEDEEVSEILRSISKKMPYQVPQGYMESFASVVMQKVRRPAKLVPVSSVRPMFRYAAAAVITGLLGLGIFNRMNNKNSASDYSQKEILADARNILSTNSFDQTLESIPAEDIVSYLENKGQDVDAAIVAVAASQAELPEPEEYLFDESTLENFLNDLNL